MDERIAERDSHDLPRRIGFWGALSILIGVVIGSGIFKTPSSIAGYIESPWVILAFWVVGGAIALCGALTFAELAAMLPRSGGIYVFLREGFGRCPAFVFGWTYLLITKPAAAGGIVLVFAEHFNALVGVSWDARIETCIVLFLLTLINVLGVRGSTFMSVALTAFKFVALGGIVILGIAVAIAQVLRGEGGEYVHAAPVERSLFAAIVPVMVMVMWTYDGWADVGSIAGEVKNPQRTLPRVYIVGTLAVMTIYLLVNAVYLWHIPIDEMRTTTTIAPLLVERVLGEGGATAVTLMILLSTVGSSHASVMTGARVTFAQARDGLLFRFLGRIHPRYETPAVSLWVQLALSCAAVWMLGSFEALAASFVFMMWISYGAAALAVFLLRIKRPNEARPFRVPGYPWVPAVFVLASGAMTVLAIVDDPMRTGIGLGVLAAGVPVYLVWRRWIPVGDSASSP